MELLTQIRIVRHPLAAVREANVSRAIGSGVGWRQDLDSTHSGVGADQGTASWRRSRVVVGQHRVALVSAAEVEAVTRPAPARRAAPNTRFVNAAVARKECRRVAQNRWLPA